MAPVGTLGTEHNSHADEGNKKPMEQPSPERRQRPLAAVAPYRTKPGIKNNTRSLSSGRAHHVHQRPASALGHPSFTPLAEALPLTRGNSLILLSSKDAQRNNTDDSPSPRRVRLQNGGSPRLSPPPSPSPRGQPGRVLVPVPDDFNLDGMEDSRFDLPRRRRSARFASLISRFGQDAARRLTKSPTPSPLSTLVRPDRDEPPRPTIRPANRQSGAFGVTDDGSDAESTHRFYHDNTRRRRNSCGSIVEEAVRSLYAENADIHSHSEEEDEMPPKDKRKTSGALGLLYLMPHDSAQQSNSASDLSCAGLDTSSSSPPGLSRSSSQWTPTNDSLATPTSASPCSTLCVSPDTAESLLLAASHLLNTHGVTLLHHAEQLSESSTRLRALATESLEWGSRLMAAANRSREAIQPPQMITAENLSQSPTPVPRSSTDGQQRAFPKPAPLPARRKDEHRLSQRATKRKSWILKPIRHSRLLVEAERLAALDWNGSQAGERAHCTEPGDTSATSSDEYVLISGSCLSTSPEPISRVPSPSMSDAQHDMPTAFSSSVDPLRDESINSHESAISDGDIDALPSLLPPIDLTPPTPRAVPSVTTREPPVSESLLNDDSTGVLFGLPSGSPEPEYPDNPSTPTLSTMSLNPEDRSSERNRSTLSLQMDFGVVHAPFATMMNPGPAVPDRGFYLDPQFAQTSITQPSARVTPMPQVLPRKSETDLSSRIRRRLSSRRRVREPERAGSTTPRRWFGRLGRQTEQLH
ncbi:hypothetical protein CspHIS471_0410120 [Cutaneotrichosporon sp. HIS471]|nr:hypothetical protein CspHIS471_0410120 [Cutaneotrichosporon sp. HIS471]